MHAGMDRSVSTDGHVLLVSRRESYAHTKYTVLRNIAHVYAHGLHGYRAVSLFRQIPLTPHISEYWNSIVNPKTSTLVIRFLRSFESSVFWFQRIGLSTSFRRVLQVSVPALRTF